MNGHTVSKQRLRQFSEEGFEQAADYIQVLPSLWRQRMSIIKTNINILSIKILIPICSEKFY